MSSSRLSLDPSAAGWQLSLYPDAGEGGGNYRRWIRKPSPYVARGQAKDPERAAAEAARRARTKLRRYCAANGINKLGTLTYGPPYCFDPEQVRSDLARYFRDLRDELGGEPFPYVWIPEYHKDGERLHAHYGVGKWISQKLMGRVWGHGWVHIKLLGNLPVGAGKLSQSRRAAGYLSKYVSKTFEDPSARVLGLHRYDVAQGFQPKSVVLTGETSGDVLAQASEVFGESPSLEWYSREMDAWEGPPSVWAQWGR